MSDLEDRRAGPTPGLRLMEVKFSAASFTVGVVGTEPVDRKRLRPLTPVATEGVVAVINTVKPFTLIYTVYYTGYFCANDPCTLFISLNCPVELIFTLIT